MRDYKILSLAIIAMLFLFSACGSDKAEGEPTNSDLITATWKINDIEIGLTVLGQSTSFEDLGFANPIDSLLQQDIQLEFKTGGVLVTTFTSSEANVAPVTRNGTWAFLENETKVKLSGLFTTEDFNSDFIDADIINDLETYQVNKLTNTAMELTSEVKLTVDVPSLPLPVPLVIEITLSLSKQ